MKIAVDAMGGDNAPYAVIEGSIQALNELGMDLILVGDEVSIKAELTKYTYDKSRIEVIHTSQVITTDESPVNAIRKKKDSSLTVGMRLVKEGKAEAFISAGSTGALLAGSLFIIGRINGIDRPAIAPILPGKNGAFMIIDAGANADSKPKNLLQSAIMGSVYFKKVLGIDNPKVGLVNIGVEEEKGNELTKSSYKLLKEADINFYGNIEPRDVPYGYAQVVVCDGFVGNTILKLMEGTTSLMFDILKEEISASNISKIGGLFLKPTFRKIKKRFDYTEYGGAALLGINGAVIKAHGSSNAKAIKNAIKQAQIFVENGVLPRIKESIDAEIQKGINEHDE